MESTQNANGANTRSVNNKELSRTRVRYSDVVLRALALVLTLVAAILVGVDKQTKVVQVQLSANLPVMSVPVHAKWHYLSAFVYFVATNSIACGYAAISIILSLMSSKSGKKGLVLVIAALDVVVVALLFSGIGAAGAVGLIGYQGNSHVQWNKVCNTFGRFCGQIAGGLVVSFLGSIVFLLLILLSLFKLQKRN